MNMPFGKHKGSPVESLPTNYLDWLNGLALTEPLRSAVVDEIKRRYSPAETTSLGSDMAFAYFPDPDEDFY